MRIKKVKQLTGGKWLKLYQLDVENRNEELQDYYLASRRPIDNLVVVNSENKKICDGVVIVPVLTTGEVVMIEQFRPLVNEKVFEFPAGLLKNGEDFLSGAKRELKEETGLECLSSEVIIKNSYSSTGITDERVAVVEMIVDGELSTENNEVDEEITLHKIVVDDIPEFIKTHEVQLRETALLLYLYNKHVDILAQLAIDKK